MSESDLYASCLTVQLFGVSTGEEGHETTTKFPCLVCVDRVSHTVDIHLSDTKIAVRDSLQRRTQGGGGFHGLRIR
ncbi:DUF5431 family protein [Escherichia coli]|nr:DUF5431 family protein [Escherichia coli]